MADYGAWQATQQQESKKDATSNPSSLKQQPQSVLNFTSRRSPVLGRHAMVATSQPCASTIGYDFLRQGANAADTAVAVAAALAVTEPCSTGLGGDMFSLYYDAAERKVHAMNGSGASPMALTRERIVAACPSTNKSDDFSTTNATDDIDATAFTFSALSVTVPGAAAGWERLLRQHGSGRFTMAQLLEPAAVLAEQGVPIGPITAHHWAAGMPQIKKWYSGNNNSNDDDDANITTKKLPMTKFGSDTEPPSTGDLFVNPDLARVLRDLGRDGADRGFYRGVTGRAICDAVQRHGGCLTMEDLAMHIVDESSSTNKTVVTPVSTHYRGHTLWQVPPNGQGVAGLIALVGVRRLEETNRVTPIDATTRKSADTYHALLESMRLGFSDVRAHVGDPAHMPKAVSWLMDEERIAERVDREFSPDRATIVGAPDPSSCTVSFQVVDADGNAISFVNSNFMGFGTGIVPDHCGFTLQNRAAGFSLDPHHTANAVGPGKRPYHTIIPALITHTDTQELYATLSNMGGNMQPQGHLQLTINLLAAHMNPQEAIDAPRFCIPDGTKTGHVVLEDGVPEAVAEDLRRRGHAIPATPIRGHERSIFGRAQIIHRDRATGILWGGSDGRADGCAMGF